MIIRVVSDLHPFFHLRHLALPGLLALGIWQSCHCPAPALQETQTVQGIRVTVQDASGESGCRLILHPAQGPDLLPVSFSNEPISFYPEGIYTITYTPDSTAIYACTAPAIPVHIITCTPVQTGPPEGTGGIKPPRRHCAQTSDPYRIPWMTQVMAQLDPDKVTRYQQAATTVYDFESPKGHYLFDCRGDLVCQSAPGETPCEASVQLSEPFVILVRNH